MDTLDIYTIGNAYFLDKIFNAIRIIFDGDLANVLKIAAAISLGILAIRASVTQNFKETVKWSLGVVVLTSLFLTTKAKVVIHDQLPDQQGRLQAVYVVDDVPWGLAWIASSTSQVGKAMMDKFESAFAGVTNNPTYRKYGILFGSKIVEDASRIRISNADLRGFMVRFYRQCMVPDFKMGHSRKNGYTLSELTQAEDITEFLKDHASRARNIYLSGTVTKKEKKSGLLADILGSTLETQSTLDGYVSCNKAAEHISDMIDFEVEKNKHKISSSFIGQFMGDNKTVAEKNKFYEMVLTDTYGAFLKSSREASKILQQNVMINALKDSATSISNTYGQTATEEMTRSSLYSVSQVFQKFIPIIRSVFECLFYGVAPLVIILMVTPIGFEVVKNYAFSFVYLQMWPPMYAILYTITESWSRFSSSGLKHNIESLPQIESINYDISMVSGYMLALIPMLSMVVTKGLVASIGNMATSMMYIPQTAAVHASDQAVKGNYSFGSTNMDTHSFDNVNAHKHDDNYSWMSGMKSFALPSGAVLKEAATGQRLLDASPAVSNLGGVGNINWGRAVGSRLDQSETMAAKEVETSGKDYVESASSGMSKVLGYDNAYSQGTSAHDAINKSLTNDQRQAFDNVRSVTDKIAKDSGISSEDALRMSVSVKGGFGTSNNGISFEGQGYTTSQIKQGWNQAQEASKDQRFSESLSQVESFGKTNSVQTQESETQSVIDSMKGDFTKSTSASSRHSQAMENLHSIQEAKSNYKTNSQSVDLNLNNKFADWGMAKFGAETFEQMALNNPKQLQETAQKFLTEEVGGDGGYKLSSLSKTNYDLTNDDFNKIENRNLENRQSINGSSGNEVGNAEAKKQGLQNRYTQQNQNFEKTQNMNAGKITEGAKQIDATSNQQKNEVNKKVNQLASEQAGSRIMNTVTNKKDN
jgi:conjugal transfer mating pair stabilization protein TraG